MATLSSTRVAEMLSDLDDYETSWNEFEIEFLTSIKDKLEENGDKFKLIGRQQDTLEKIYNRYCKEPSY